LKQGRAEVPGFVREEGVDGDGGDDDEEGGVGPQRGEHYALRHGADAAGGVDQLEQVKVDDVEGVQPAGEVWEGVWKGESERGAGLEAGEGEGSVVCNRTSQGAERRARENGEGDGKHREEGRRAKADADRRKESG
jgi:hypothetical protein